MSPSGIVIPAEYAYVAGALASTIWLNIWQFLRVARARKAAKIDYPQMYAEVQQAKDRREAHLFNCAQRAHQNTLESLPTVLISTAIAGVQFPTYAAAGLGLWVAGRVLYTIGYSTGEPAKRSRGTIGTIAMLGLILGASYTAVDLIRSI
ncbi:membrane-associated proteins in eicosanoid and glutathione metabolism [Coniophora puteana RWD-64-598 SS2]|uniref:Glutathione S-transferase 3, mitochondrial n=1 Tax=Coniophora puteana (strain RWD-64-598) TaxID=741705 RepID=A0A5M3MWV2_CONPW|nr:membrane-associated proteins in eicosanoid and glutathione metabolism [Coniophora puteana RWD-64-598 SS2]EIW83550.1 membrane-associated proteins in eicosanoid and glutathione metabolism [Coniophora puteana RWD-64-598 SS2]